MKTTPEHNERIAKMTFASVFPHYIKKVESKGRTKAELLEVIEWLTGFDEIKLNELIEEKVNFETFFNNANLNPKAELITGLICGYRIEELENPITKKTRYLDKLVDELVIERKMHRIFRMQMTAWFRCCPNPYKGHIYLHLPWQRRLDIICVLL